MAAADPEAEEQKDESKVDISSMTSMLNARWKGGAAGGEAKADAASGQVRSFRSVALDPSAKKIELELE
jgi:small subunit ribosomal protein S1